MIATLHLLSISTFAAGASRSRPKSACLTAQRHCSLGPVRSARSGAACAWILFAKNQVRFNESNRIIINKHLKISCCNCGWLLTRDARNLCAHSVAPFGTLEVGRKGGSGALMRAIFESLRTFGCSFWDAGSWKKRGQGHSLVWFVLGSQRVVGHSQLMQCVRCLRIVVCNGIGNVGCWRLGQFSPWLPNVECSGLLTFLDHAGKRAR